ncbi:MAG: hypothetical protein JXA37_13975 [Chloroflexia bacterium]|nr:hypothetical protein [Chloroflexia bacterium]
MLFLLLILLSLAGSTPVAGQQSSVAPTSPVEVNLDWQGQPGLNRTVTLSIEIRSEVAADNLILYWALPAGLRLSGPLNEFLGPIAAGQTITCRRDLTFDQAGEFKVVVGARINFPQSEMILSDADALYFRIQPGAGSDVSRQAHIEHTTQERIDTPHVTISPKGNHPQAGYHVRGRFMFLDQQLAASYPFTVSYQLVPARQVRVEVWEDDGVIDGPSLADDHDCTTRTDDEGYFECWVSDNDDGWFGGDKDTYVRFYANSPGGKVTDISGIDREYYCYTGNQAGGSDIDFGSLTPTDFHPMFNIADALLDGYNYVVSLRGSAKAAHARYEPGRGEEGSLYSRVSEEITLGDAGGDADAYDDSVILHEYGHFMADRYSCIRGGGGEHYVDRHYNTKLAWSEGWANYFSSASRNNPRYFDVDDAEGVYAINWENWHIDYSGVTGSTNEGAVCATLWDIHDSVDETHDRLSLGGGEIWNTVEQGMTGYRLDYDRNCNVYEFWDDWHTFGYPADSELAAIFGQHGTAGITAALAERNGAGQAISSTMVKRAPQPAGASPNTMMRGDVPWNATLFLVDATGSMSEEINAVSQIIQDKVTEMDAEPIPYEYLVETFQDDGTNTPVVDHFFPDVVNPPVGGITVGGGGDPEEDSMAALNRGTAGRPGYDAWLFTDAAPQTYPVNLEPILQNRQITPYLFIFGDCSDGNSRGAGADAGADDLDVPASALRPSHLPRFAPDALDDCLEPYLQLADKTNGQVLPIAAGQVDDAAEIVRAIMGNNAGAGRYSNYVSSDWTYTWEDYSDYYDWMDASAGTAHNIYDYEQVDLFLGDFPFYGANYSSVYVAAPGYVSFGSGSGLPDNTAIPSTAAPNNAIYAFWDDVTAYLLPKDLTPDQSPTIYTMGFPTLDRFVIEYHDAYHVGTTDYETFEIILNYYDDSILLQYAEVTDDASCTVGVEDASGTVATQVAHNDSGALYAGRAIKFTPVPPVPTRDHEILVDSTMDGVVFLLNGFSGDVDLTVYDPNDDPISGADPDVTYLDVGKVKYYRVSNPDTGTWTARASGDGTYYFTSSAQSPLEADLEGDRSLRTSGTNLLLLNLGLSLTTQPAFSLVYPDGTLHASVDLYDDGVHDDGKADDGLYGGQNTVPYTYQSLYLQVDGQLPSGEAFRRTALTPLHTHRIVVAPMMPQEQFAYPEQAVVHMFQLFNPNGFPNCYTMVAQSSQGWSTPVAPAYQCLNPGASGIVQVFIVVPSDTNGLVDETVLTIWDHAYQESDDLALTTIVRGLADELYLAAYPDRIDTGGREALIVAQVADDHKWGVADGTLVTFETTLGSLEPISGTTVDGLFTTTLTSGAGSGTALVQATVGDVTEAITVEIVPPQAYDVYLEAQDDELTANGISTTLLTAYVNDKYGDPAPDGTEVFFVVEGDDMRMGRIEGGQSYTTTISGGQALATYCSGLVPGSARVRAAISLGGAPSGGEGVEGWRWYDRSIQLHFAGGYRIFLPVVFKGS